MIPRAQMDVVDINESAGELHPFRDRHRALAVPAVIGQNRDDVIGILLAKDLLRHYAGEEEFNVREMLRPAVFVPESKRLNVLLREFRASRNHMAMVIDEYGGVAGLVTIEDVLEQIVGDIEDEYDYDEDEDNILLETDGGLPGQGAHADRRFQRRPPAPVSPTTSYDTVGGLVIANAFGRLPKRGEALVVGGLKVQVLRADSRRVYTLIVEKPKA